MGTLVYCDGYRFGLLRSETEKFGDLRLLPYVMSCCVLRLKTLLHVVSLTAGCINEYQLRTIRVTDLYLYAGGTAKPAID